MCQLCEAVIEQGYLPFLVVGIGVNEGDTPVLRLAGEFTITRKMPEEYWRIIRQTLITSLDSLRESPLDDLERR